MLRLLFNELYPLDFLFRVSADSVNSLVGLSQLLNFREMRIRCSVK